MEIHWKYWQRDGEARYDPTGWKHKSVSLKIFCMFLTFHIVLLSVSKTSEAAKFDKSGCKILNQEKKVISVPTKRALQKGQSVNTTEKSNEILWHRWYGHVGEQNLLSVANDKLVEQFDYKSSGDLGF